MSTIPNDAGDRVRAALKAAIRVADEARDEWDADNDTKVGKLLIALSGHAPGYRADIDEIHAALQAQGELGWREIGSAPKNGTRIWLGDAKNVVTGYWSPPAGGWRCDWLVGAPGDKPTHWLPLTAFLPSPPAGGR